MRFELDPARQYELTELVDQLRGWVRELEDLDLAAYDPILVPDNSGGEEDLAIPHD